MQITALDPAFAASAAGLLNEALGAGTYSADGVATLARDADQVLYGAHDGEVLVGVAGARLLPANEAWFYVPFGPRAEAVFAGRRVGSLFTSAVAPEHRGRGVGKALATARLVWLAGRGCDYAIGISWISGLPHTSRPVFERLGFAVLGEAPDFFVKSSTEQGWRCGVCGNPCRCAAVLFGRALDVQSAGER